MGNYEFDLDLPEGEFAEKLIQDLFAGERGKVEVKRDFKVSNTGNVAIEYESRGHKSGIATTKATWWALVLDGHKFAHQVIIFVKTDRLRDIARDYYKKGNHKPGGDNKSSKMVLIPIEEIFKRKGQPIQPDLI